MIKNIAGMLPFLDSEDLYELAHEILNDNVDMNVIALLPFMDEDAVDKLCDDLANNPQWAKKVNLTAFYPFASEEYVDKLFLSQAEQGKIDNEALPFVSGEALHNLILKYAETPDLEINIDLLYPFLDGEDISLLFKTYLKKNKKNKNNEK